MSYIKLLETVEQSLKSKLLFTLFLFAFVFLLTYPKYLETLQIVSPEKTYAYFFDKIDNPLAPVNQISTESHGSKIAYRFTVPLLAKIMGISSEKNGKAIVFIYILQSLLLFPFLYLLQRLVNKLTSALNSSLFVLACSATYLAKSFFWDYDFWLDGFAFFFMFLGMYFRSGVSIFTCLQLACWTDERAFIALPGIYLFHVLRENDFNILLSWKSIIKVLFSKTSTWIIVSGITYLIIRGILNYVYGLSTPSGEEAGVSLALIPFQLKHRLIGIFLTFEGLWLIFGYVVYHLYKHKGIQLLVFLLSILMIQLLVAYSVFDITRSITYAFPLFIITYIIFCRTFKTDFLSLIKVSTLLCVAIPTQYLIFFPRQIPWTISSLPELWPICAGLLKNYL